MNATPLVRLPPRLGQNPQGSGYRETTIQDLIQAHPSILPIREIEPVFEGLRPICTELRLSGAGREKYVDNLLITPGGRICLVECKLWRNGEAEREAVAQILDYAGEVAQLSYEEFRDTARRSLKREAGDPIVEAVLGQNVSEQQRGDFIDAVSRSLSRGEFLLLLVGDYIRPGVRGITEYLQGHAGLGFAFGLIEMAMYRRNGGDGPVYLQPRILARTEIITRTVFVAASERAVPKIIEVEKPKKPTTLSEQEFFAELGTVNPAYPQQVTEFLARCRDRGCVPVLRRRYVLYVDDPTGNRLNLGTIDKNGTREFWGMSVRDTEIGEPVGRRYMEEIVSMLGAATIKEQSPNPGNWHVSYDGRATVPLSQMLASQDRWLDAISRVVDRFAELSRKEIAG